VRPLLLLLAVAVSACSASPGQQQGGQPELRGDARALDGDTVSIDFRFSGADAVERKQQCERAGSCYPCGKIAQDATARMLRSGEASIQLVGSSSYGRPVGIVSVNGSDLGEQRISQGFAVPATKYLKSDPERATRYVEALEDARRHGRGVHSGEWIEPEKWRRGERLACERR
jgi:micrococcal nuclease